MEELDLVGEIDRAPVERHRDRLQRRRADAAERSRDRGEHEHGDQANQRQPILQTERDESRNYY